MKYNKRLKNRQNGINRKNRQNVSCPNQMLLATLLATNKCVGGQIKKGINIPFYDILEMKDILLENKNA